MNPLLEKIPLIGKDLSSILNELLALKKKLDAKIQNSQTDDEALIKDFANSIFNSKGLAYEHDIYTELIVKLIKSLKTEELPDKERQSVLIIDDLDRIDPDNIFRLLNVFSVHLDLDDPYKNKFNFDKIVFTCDLDNIRKIFAGKFGQDISFTGYIDKFYSTTYRFDNRIAIKQSVQKIIQTINPSRKKLWDKSKISTQPNYSYGYIIYVIESMVDSKVFTLRQLMKLNEKTYIENEHTPENSENDLYIYRLFDFLVSIFGDAQNTKNAIMSTYFSQKQSSEIESLIVNIALTQKPTADFNTTNEWTDPQGLKIFFELNIVSKTDQSRIARIATGYTMPIGLNVQKLLIEAFMKYLAFRPKL